MYKPSDTSPDDNQCEVISAAQKRTEWITSTEENAQKHHTDRHRKRKISAMLYSVNLLNCGLTIQKDEGMNRVPPASIRPVSLELPSAAESAQ